MTNIIFERKNGKIIRFRLSGHVGKAEFGKDVVCAAISSVAQSTAVGLCEVLKLDVELKFDDAFMSLSLKECDYENEIAQVLLETCLKSLREIKKNNQKFVKLEEKNEI